MCVPLLALHCTHGYFGKINLSAVYTIGCFFGRVSVERPLFANVSSGGLRLLKWEVSAGAGVAFQKFSATNGGATVLNGSATTPMVNFSGGFKLPVTGNIDIGVNGYATWFDSYNVSTGTVSSKFDETWDLGVFATLRFRLPRK